MTRTYILERTRDFFTGRPDEPCSGVVRLVPTDSGAATLRPAASTAALCTPNCSGAYLPTVATTGVGPWPPPATREMCTFGVPLPQISKDLRRAVRRRNPPPAVRSVSTPSPLTSPATGASARSLRRGGRSRQRGGGMEPTAPPTASVGRPDEAGLSAPYGRPGHRAPRGDGPPAGPFRRGELLITSSSPCSSCTRLTVAASMMLLLWRGEVRTRTTATCRSNPPPHWPRRRSTTTPAMDPH
jgi:hypothetical protein